LYYRCYLPHESIGCKILSQTDNVFGYYQLAKLIAQK
jgi:hypothetical protein